MVVYKITNLINNKIYIGQTRSKLRDRWNSHCRNKNRSLITYSINKYGKENFTIEIIDTAANKQELNQKEAYWIRHYNSDDRNIGYNIMKGGDNNVEHSEETKKIISNRAKSISEETRRKMSEAKLGKKQSPELIKKRVEARMGYKWSEESKQKSREKQKGRKFSKEHREKLSIANKGKKLSKENLEKLIHARKTVKISEESRERYRLAAKKREEKRRLKRLENE